MSLEIRPAAAADRGAILELFRVAFRSEPNPDEWTWKYDRNPLPGISIVAMDGSRALGYFGSMGTRYRGSGGDLPGTSAVDVMTHPEARKLGHNGLFKQIGEAFRESNAACGVPFDFGFPHERARKVEERLLGCITIEPEGRLSRPLAAAPAARPGRLLRLVRDEPFGKSHDGLVERIHERAGWRTDRRSDVLNWRFRERPGADYLTFQLLGPLGGSRGYAVIRVVGDRALVVDLQARDESDGALPDLLSRIAASLSLDRGRLEVRVPRSGRLFARLTSELGFTEVAGDTHFFVRPYDPRFDLMSAARAFDYRFADHDVF